MRAAHRSNSADTQPRKTLRALADSDQSRFS
jgi:hypothetical protein